ncbi:helix-turn-helix transcriptional regulator [Arthrobacter sp. MYb224]|uniref:helix-turn-helix transcriptional regulator n=1 Tax=Arthrobacter sp. MYb224 TaxID=1848600 RepID=UPI000CFD9813|nr:LuxR family transcriptional regulator [Arthrobacter sp. MYb224]PRA00367.1 helix-turn-helix transcriptional regulator [Arthrobacter sp. MYb224]
MVSLHELIGRDPNSDARLWELLDSLSLLATAPLLQIAERLHASLQPWVKCSALLIFTEECTGRPQKKAGSEAITSRVTIAELDQLRSSHPEQDRWRGTAGIGGAPREVLALRYPPSNALLVLTDPVVVQEPAESGSSRDLLDYLWQLTAARIREKVADAPPSYLRESRAVSAERTRVTTELVDQYSTSLDLLLATLRSTQLSDALARAKATDLAAKTLVGLRSLDDRINGMAEEPVGSAFTRLREDLRPLSESGGVELQFIEPPADGRALPGEVAYAARSIMRGLALVMMDQEQIHRIRAQWDCDGENLLINMRDDGRGAMDQASPTIERLNRQVQALAGRMELEVISEWGTDVSIVLPLDAPQSMPADLAQWKLAAREFEVLQLLAAGQGNRAISAALGISENTVKFHVRNLFKKLDVRSRAEAAALAHSRGVPDAASGKRWGEAPGTVKRPRAATE